MTTETDDAQLGALMVLGSVRAFDLLYLRHAAMVRRMGVAMLRSPDAAEDLVQDTFLQLWRDRARYSPQRASLKTWLLGIARNRAIDRKRAQAGQERMIEAARGIARIAVPPADPLTKTVSRDEANRLRAAVAHLPSAQRRAVILVYGGGLTNAEVAQRTGVPLGTVKSRLRLGRERIAWRLEPGRRVNTPSAA